MALNAASSNPPSLLNQLEATASLEVTMLPPNNARLPIFLVSTLLIPNPELAALLSHKFDADVKNGSANGTLTSLGSTENCTADLTVVTTPTNFNGKWAVTADPTSNASCCYPASFNLSSANNKVTINGTWPATDSCKKGGYVGAFSKVSQTADILNLNFVFADIGGYPGRLALQKWNNNMFYEWWLPLGYKCHANAKRDA